MKLNPDKELVEMIDQAIKKNKEEFGFRFCPCVPSEFYFKENYKDYICPCKEFIQNTAIGETCHCGKFIKE